MYKSTSEIQRISSALRSTYLLCSILNVIVILFEVRLIHCVCSVAFPLYWNKISNGLKIEISNKIDTEKKLVTMF